MVSVTHKMRSRRRRAIRVKMLYLLNRNLSWPESQMIAVLMMVLWAVTWRLYEANRGVHKSGSVRMI